MNTKPYAIICKVLFSDMKTFVGPLFHTSMWRKDVSLVGKRVAIIGTGCTSVQIVPEIAEKVGELYVFQRTAAWSPPKTQYDYSNRAKVSRTNTLFIYFQYNIKICSRIQISLPNIILYCGK